MSTASDAHEDARAERKIEITVRDQSQLRGLRDWMRAQRGVDVRVTAGTPGPGELGVLDVLSVAAGSGGVLATAIATLPDFIRARRSSFRIEMTIDGQPFILHGTNLDTDLPCILERLRDG
ncbi:MAG: hypothetical protein ABSA93_27495 [Streptosporangiaceae bacterium]